MEEDGGDVLLTDLQERDAPLVQGGLEVGRRGDGTADLERQTERVKYDPSSLPPSIPSP